MTINDQLKAEKLQYDVNREAETSVLSSDKIDKCEYHTVEEILPLNQKQIIIYLLSLGKRF